MSALILLPLFVPAGRARWAPSPSTGPSACGGHSVLPRDRPLPVGGAARVPGPAGLARRGRPVARGGRGRPRAPGPRPHPLARHACPSSPRVSLAALLFAFIVSVNEFIMALFLATPGTRTFPVVIWPQIRYLLTPVVAAASSVIILLPGRPLRLRWPRLHQRAPADGVAVTPRDPGRMHRLRPRPRALTLGDNRPPPGCRYTRPPRVSGPPVRLRRRGPRCSRAIVTPDGKVDYQALAERRARLDGLRRGTSAPASPESTPRASPATTTPSRTG